MKYCLIPKIKSVFIDKITFCLKDPSQIAQLVAYRLCTGEVPGSNPGKGENFSVKIGNWIVGIYILICNSNIYI